MALLSGGGYAELAKVHKSHLIEIPDGISFTQAAAIPEVWLTSFQLVHQLGQVQQSDTVLVHAAASGIGTAALQLCKSAGATAVAVASTDDKLSFASSLGAAHGINYKTSDFASEMQNLGLKANIILDCIGASNYDSVSH